MTREEFERLEDKWQTVYLNERKPIKMVSKRSSKEDCILWYDSDECSHTVHYSEVETEQCDIKKEFAENEKKLMVGDYYYDYGVKKYRRVNMATFSLIAEGYENICIKPIALTKDILERNGFHITNGVVLKCWGDSIDDVVFDYMVSCDICGMDDVVTYIHIRVPHIGIGMPLDKVNEFLHALRLCGLGEMADGFKL